MAENKTGIISVLILAALGVSLLFLPTGTNSEILKIKSGCQELQNREQCYAKAFENLTKATDRDHAFEVLRALQQTDPEARGCHFIAHAISTAETQKDPSKWKELMNSSPPDCSYGAAHGAL